MRRASWAAIVALLGSMVPLALATAPAAAESPPAGRVFAYGLNYNGQLGAGSTVSTSQPLEATGTGDVVAVAAGNFHSLAVRADGSVMAWGSNYRGQVGDGTSRDRLSPVPVAGLSSACAMSSPFAPMPCVTAVAAGESHSLALRADGSVMAWGGNDSGQLGVGSVASKKTPVQVPELTGVTAIAAAGKHNLALKADGSIWAWGKNDKGQLGDGTTVTRTAPVAVQGYPDPGKPMAGVVAIAAGAWEA
ncbi:MAG: RCC1 domain-containing protein, partial [Candidatus Dormibacteria bacterium]